MYPRCPQIHHILPATIPGCVPQLAAAEQTSDGASANIDWGKNGTKRREEMQCCGAGGAEIILRIRNYLFHEKLAVLKSDWRLPG